MINQLLHRKQWLFYDQAFSGLTMNPIHSFAMDDTLCQKAASLQDSAFARSWVHDKTVVLGIQDSRLPFIKDGIRFLHEKGYDVIVRNSGGLAVVLDPGIYNLSLIFKEEKGLTIDHGYEMMVRLTRGLIEELGADIVDGEIKESYCPGRYDLSVNGQKFAGISQRRLRGGVAVQIYLAMSGSGSQRASLIRDFYTYAVNQAETKFKYPHISPEKMASLEELAGCHYTAETLNHRLLLQLQQLSDRLTTYQLNEEDWSVYENNIARMVKRNEKLPLPDHS
ncbi:lipoate--protein ligase family protein [Salipaludibacillus sp. LMS25]|jgi:octanoyl-[GcvH]:protein N-octanoyltransferase|uniref:lipoate--protein ligase family protein n=1 Tax=Salipaludibacillus sp. LMS25 TaxID=2924031 RepID=UPI0020D01394|nr:lipoate--protein ligase family protein [Salipaludibacillus sp. LMS25]UTR16300.1 lipoate--protein ligase family protein [Salipaludibacillus sp. LMS25]